MSVCSIGGYNPVKDIIILNYSNCHVKVPMTVTESIVTSSEMGFGGTAVLTAPHTWGCASFPTSEGSKAPSQPHSLHKSHLITLISHLINLETALSLSFRT